MARRYGIIAIAVLAVLAIVLAFWRNAARLDPTPAPVSGGQVDEDMKAPPPVAPTSRGKLPHDITGLEPGEVIPGTMPGTVIVQPLQPGPPKEIYDSYLVPTADEDPRIDRLADGRLVFHDAVALARQLHKKNADPYDDLGILEGILGYYRLMYRENPVTEDNTAVLKALTGSNKQQIVVFPNDHPDLDANGRLLDRWGTPYFFHALSGTQMDIWSAGADGKFNTTDDVRLGESDATLQLNRGETDEAGDSDG